RQAGILGEPIEADHVDGRGHYASSNLPHDFLNCMDMSIGLGPLRCFAIVSLQSAHSSNAACNGPLAVSAGFGSHRNNTLELCSSAAPVSRRWARDGLSCSPHSRFSCDKTSNGILSSPAISLRRKTTWRISTQRSLLC